MYSKYSLLNIAKGAALDAATGWATHLTWKKNVVNKVAETEIGRSNAGTFSTFIIDDVR